MSSKTYLSGVYECLLSFDGEKSPVNNSFDDDNELAVLFSLYTKRNYRKKLRREINKNLNSTQYINKEDIKSIVKQFISSVKYQKEKNVTKEAVIYEPSLFFYCKCGWHFYNRDPTTLPCGHTICKECVEEYKMCRHCDYEIVSVCQSNIFLIDLISNWCKKQYKISEIKKETAELMKAKEYKKALASINKLSLTLPTNNEDFNLLNIRSEIFSKLGFYRKALRDAKKSCKINEKCGQSHYQLGLCLADIGQLNEAVDAFQICLELEPYDLALSNAVISSINMILNQPNAESSLKVSLQSSSDLETECESSLENSKLDHQNADTFSMNNYKDIKMVSTVCKDIHTDSNPSDKSCKTDIHCAEVMPEKLKHGIPENLIKNDDLECNLCFEVFLEPVTTTCGHVFCKSCLLRTLDHNAICPICRSPLSDYMKNPLQPSLFIEQILEVFFEESYNKRKLEHKLRMEKLSRVGMDENIELPIFVCSIAFPYVQCPLHIFEPKYRLMIRECLESGSRKFGMCISLNGDEMSDIGTICEIKKFQRLPDGRFIVHTIASQRFLVKSKTTKDSLIYATVTYFKDQSDDLSQEQNLTSKTIYNQLLSYVNSLSTAEQDCMFKALGVLPTYEEDNNKYEHGLPWVWWGLAALPLNFNAKLVLLRSKCVNVRMISLQRFLQFLKRVRPSADRSAHS